MTMGVPSFFNDTARELREKDERIAELEAYKALADEFKTQIASASGTDNLIDAAMDFEMRYDALKAASEPSR